jgi:hypothetical protein
MDKVVFNNTCSVRLQGDTALNLLSEDISSRAAYQVIGFTNPSITVFDYRTSSIRHLGEILATGNIAKFPSSFNRVASIRVLELSKESIVVELSDSSVKNPDYMLWLAIGINNPIPVYDYNYLLFDQMTEDKYALMAIYKRPNDIYKIPHHHFSDLTR